MRTLIKIGILAILAVVLVCGVSADDYCTPPDFTVDLDHNGIWYNFTITSANCYIYTECGGGYGDVCVSLCSEAAPTAGISVNKTCGIVPTSIMFTDASSGGNLSAYYWDFGDGTNSTSEDIAHEYTDVGVYSVNHSVTNEYGTSWMNKSNYIRVRSVGDTCGGGVKVYGNEAPVSPAIVIGAIGFMIALYGVRKK